MLRRPRRTRRRTREKEPVEAPSRKRKSRKPPHMRLDGTEKTVQGIDIAKIQARIDSLGGAFWKCNPGTHTLRVLPPQAIMEGDFIVEQMLHYGLEDKQGQMRAIACPLEDEGECPICEFVQELQTSGRKQDKKVAQDLRQTRQLLTCVIVRPQKQVRIWRVPVSIYTKLGKATANAMIGDFTHPIHGRDLCVTRTGTTLYNTKYDVQVLDKGKIRVKGWANKLPDLSRILAPKLSLKAMRIRLRRSFG